MRPAAASAIVAPVSRTTARSPNPIGPTVRRHYDEFAPGTN
jgi:hypothetical protein